MKRISFLIFIFAYNTFANASPSSLQVRPEIKYRTNFGQCPSRAAGTLTLMLMKEFEKNNSLKEVKELILKDKLTEKHFVSEYKVDYNPLNKMLSFSFDCPAPLMKVQIYKTSGVDSYEAILVENGKLYDPTYEVLLRQEKKIHRDLPYLALPVGEMDEEIQLGVTRLINKMDVDFRAKLSEVIVNESKDLTIILSIQGRPSSVFMGKDLWADKLERLDKIVSYMETNKKVPAIINLTNDKKVVVKFNE